MPELPEVEVVRRGLHHHLVGKTIASTLVYHERAVRRQSGGAVELAGLLAGQQISGTGRRGKYLWLTLEGSSGAQALVVHLGMSGQMLIGPISRPQHLRIAATLDDGSVLSFVDQRTFGGWMVTDLVTVDGSELPEPVAHIARDPLDELFEIGAVVTRLRGKHTEIKRALLDQTVVSGVGNIYADEALWQARVHGRRLTDGMSRAKLTEVLDSAAAVMRLALAQGGTSFDDLYVNVNGESGYFDRSLEAHGREGEPCRRCGRAMRREAFMNRSSYFCPSCQRLVEPR